MTALLDGKRVIAPKKDILEARNANQVYDRAANFDPYSFKAMLRAHGLLMKSLLPDAGKWRSGPVGTMKGSEIAHVTPKAQFVQGMVKELLTFVRSSKSTPLITSSVFHHEFEFIHPFSDGNGRMGRFWQHLLLVNFHPVFEYVPIESVIREHQREYYKALEEAD